MSTEDFYLDFYLINHNANNFIYNDLEIYNRKKISKTNNLLLFNVHTFIEEINNSFENSTDKNWYQFDLDYDRMKISINDKYYNKYIFLNSISKFINYKKNNNLKESFFSKNLFDLLILFATQASFGMIFEIIQNKFEDLDNAHYVFSDKTNINYKLNSDNNLSVIFFGNFNLKNINTNHFIRKINFKYSIDINNESDNGEVFFYNITKYGIIEIF